MHRRRATDGIGAPYQPQAGRHQQAKTQAHPAQRLRRWQNRSISHRSRARPGTGTNMTLKGVVLRVQTHIIRLCNDSVLRSFQGASGCAEHYIVIDAPGELSLPRQIDTVAQRYAEVLQTLRLSPETAIFRRIYLSDIANQAALLRQSSLFQEPL